MRRLIVGMVVAAATVLTPVWAMAGNQEVAQNIATSLRESGQLKGYKIGVKYQDGTAWLRGRVTSLEQMNTALKLAFQAPGVTRVVNELNIGSGDQPAESTELTVRQMSGAVKPERIARLGPATPSAQSQPVQVDPGAHRVEGSLVGSREVVDGIAVGHVPQAERDAPRLQPAQQVQEGIDLRRREFTAAAVGHGEVRVDPLACQPRELS